MYIYIYIYVCVCVCVCIYVYIYMCVCVCVCVFISKIYYSQLVFAFRLLSLQDDLATLDATGELLEKNKAQLDKNNER